MALNLNQPKTSAFAPSSGGQASKRTSHLHEGCVQAIDGGTFDPVDGSSRDIRDANSGAVAYTRTLDDVAQHRYESMTPTEAQKSILRAVDTSCYNVLAQMDAALTKSQRHLAGMEQDMQREKTPFAVYCYGGYGRFCDLLPRAVPQYHRLPLPLLPHNT